MDMTVFTSGTWDSKKTEERPKISVVGAKPSVILEESAPEVEKKKWHEMSSVKIDPTTLSEKEIKRQETIFELIETEESYLHDLALIIEVRHHGCDPCQMNLEQTKHVLLRSSRVTSPSRKLSPRRSSIPSSQTLSSWLVSTRNC